MSAGEEVGEDYHHLGLSLKHRPLALLRRRLTGRGIMTSAQVRDGPARSPVKPAGLVIDRQRPDTATGVVVFLTIEDETGVLNVIVRARVFARCRRAVLGGELVEAEGRLERDGSGAVAHLVAERVLDLSVYLDRLVAADAPRSGGGGASCKCR